MLSISQNGGSWFGLDNRPRQFVRDRKWWGGVEKGENMSGAVQWPVVQKFVW